MRAIINLDDLTDVEAQRVLFQRLYQHLAEDDRYVPLSPHGNVLVSKLCDDILAGRPIAYDERMWRGLFASVHRDGSPARQSLADRTGLLGFVSHLRRALRRFGRMTVPLNIALLTMLKCEYEPGCVDLVGGPPWQLYVTAFGSAALGVYGVPEVDEDVLPHASAIDVFEHHCATSAPAA